METGIRVLLLTVAVATLSGCATVSNWFHHRREAREERAQAREDAKRADQSPDDDSAPPRVVDPAVERRKITVPRIRSSNIEFGLDYGALSIEDFGTNPVYGITAAYHVTEDFFFQGEYGRTKAGRTSFERVPRRPTAWARSRL